MTFIHSTLMADQPIFELGMAGISKESLEQYCKYCRLDVSQFETQRKNETTFWIPGHFFLGLFRYITPQLRTKYAHNFPLSMLESFSGSNGGTYENRVFIEEDYVFRMQERVKHSSTKYLFQVEFADKRTNKIFLSGLFTFIGN